jgi:hypothetical protein
VATARDAAVTVAVAFYLDEYRNRRMTDSRRETPGLTAYLQLSRQGWNSQWNW